MTEQKKKVKACKDTEYLFISAYLRAKEPQLLNAEKAGRMLGSSVQEAARILESCGYADVLAVGLDKALSDRRAAVFSEVEALAPKDGVVSLFRMRYDYHNAKTIVKAEAVGIDPAPLLSGAGRADAQALKTAYETGESITYGLFNAQERGTLFIGPGVKVYSGMIVGQSAKPEDIELNVCKTKKLTNTRSSSADEALRLVPPKIMSLEQCLDYIDTDELLEVTPKSLRIRKKILDPKLRKRSNFQ